jgi:hypothetical protein
LCRKASLSGAKRKVKESTVEVGSREVAKVTSPRGSSARTRTRLDEKEEEEIDDRVPPLFMTWRCRCWLRTRGGGEGSYGREAPGY